jgi:hypothetical protein
LQTFLVDRERGGGTQGGGVGAARRCRRASRRSTRRWGATSSRSLQLGQEPGLWAADVQPDDEHRRQPGPDGERRRRPDRQPRHGDRADALTADGNTLYVGFLRNGNIIKVSNPSGPSQTATTVAKTSDGRGLSAMAIIGCDLYLAEGGAVTVVPNAGGCAGACVAEPTASSATPPTALAAAGSALYVADTPATTSTILRLHVDTGLEDVLATGSDTAAFRNATGLSLDGSGNRYVGDDPTAGAQILQGHISKVAPTP